MNAFFRALNSIKNLFLSGLFTIIPISLTLFFLSVAYNFSYKVLEPLRSVAPGFFSSIPGSEFVIGTLLIIALGALLKFILIDALLGHFERVITRIPLVRIVYSAAKMLVNFFQMPNASKMARRVVLIQYPRAGNYHLAFLLDSAADSYQKIIPEEWKNSPDQRFVKVFMPNSPNPTTGYFFILPEAEVVHTDITFEEAVKTLVSCGLITPESLKNLPADHSQKKNYPNPSV
jgi:uncharacterized membrane protein